MKQPWKNGKEDETPLDHIDSSERLFLLKDGSIEGNGLQSGMHGNWELPRELAYPIPRLLDDGRLVWDYDNVNVEPDTPDRSE